MQPISAVIPNKDGADLLRATLPPLLAELSAPEHEIVVVDDASEDGSVGMLAERFPTVRVVALEENVGFGGACNRGFAEARHELVLLLNSDMEVPAGSVAMLLEHFLAEDTFAAGPVYLAPGETLQAGEPQPQVGTPAGGGLFRRQAFLDLGGFDELYHPFYWEDIDLGWNAWRAGWRIVEDRRCHFVHLISATIRRLYSAGYVRRVRARNRVLFGWKNFQAPQLRRVHRAGVWRHIAADLIKRRDPASLLGWLDAVRLRQQALDARPKNDPARTEKQILADSRTDLRRLMRV